MMIFRKLKNPPLCSVDLANLISLCKDQAEKDALLQAIVDMEKQGEAKITMDSKIRVSSYENALINAGLSQETVQSILTQGDISSIATDKGTQLAEAYLNENLANGRYVEKSEVDKIVKQFNDGWDNGIDQSILKKQFESSMQALCENAPRFNANSLADAQVAAGKNSKDFEIYRKDKNNGLCLTDVPQAVIAANKDEIVAALREQYKNEVMASQKQMNSLANEAKQFSNGDAESMARATIQMTITAALLILSQVKEIAAKLDLQRKLHEGFSEINDEITNLVGLEKTYLTEEIENDMDSVDITTDFDDLM